jgi:ferric-dicitrate binding protein FerR (iron transport regulator)
MNNSEPPASPEEKWAAYLDGNLTAQDAAAFEREHPEAFAERESLARLTAAVRLHSPAPELRNADFFNESILRAITPRSAPTPAGKRRVFPLWGLAVASACCLLAAGAIYALFVRGGGDRTYSYRAQIVSVKAGDETLDATVLDADGLAVVWIDGLDQLPNDYVLE